MRGLLIFLLFYSSASFAQETIFPDDAIKYLKKLDCTFSAFAVYNGPDVSSMLGKLKKGQAFSKAVCAGSFEEGGAKKHSFCWLRVVDMKIGKYSGVGTYGSRWRDESGPCSQKTIRKILIRNRAEFSSDKNQEWRIVSDSTSALSDFKKLLDGSLEKAEYDSLRYGKYRWLYWKPTNSCSEMPGNADRNIEDKNDPATVLVQTDSKLTLKVGKDKWIYFASKDQCEKEVKLLPKEVETHEE